MNTTAAATRAGVTANTIRHWCRYGAIAAVKVAGRWVIDIASLTARIRVGTRHAQAGHHVTTRRWPITRAGRMPQDHDGKWTIMVNGHRTGRVYDTRTEAEFAAAAHRPARRAIPTAVKVDTPPITRGWSHASRHKRSGRHSYVHATMTGATGLSPASGKSCHYCGLNPRTCDCY